MVEVKDFHCGMRALRRDVLPELDLRTTGMEFASEMINRAAKQELDGERDPWFDRARSRYRLEHGLLSLGTAC